MVLVRRLLRAASPNQWRRRGGARVGPCTRAVRRPSGGDTDGSRGRAVGLPGDAGACRFVCFVWAMATGGGAWSARRGVEGPGAGAFRRTGHVSECRAAALAGAGPRRCLRAPSTGGCWRTWTRFRWRNHLGIAPYLSLVESSSSHPEFDVAGWKGGWVYLFLRAAAHKRKSVLSPVLPFIRPPGLTFRPINN